MNQHALFPTMIWSFQAEHLVCHHANWVAQLDQQRASSEEGQGRSTRLGWSGPKTLFSDPVFKPLAAECHKAILAAFKAMEVPPGFAFELEAWANIHDPGGFNRPHIHREAVLSGCFYLSVPEGAGAIMFHDPRPATLYSRPWGRGANRWESRGLKPAAGTLLVFPHWLEHSVEPNESCQPRYSVAFNAVLPRPRQPKAGT